MADEGVILMFGTTKKRVLYLLLTLALIAVEVLIALYVHDDFIRPYIGDVLVVVVIYIFLRIWIPNGAMLLPVYVFLFAVGVEILQYFHIVDKLGLADNRFMRILIGGTFDWKDILCYGVGCGILMVIEIFKKKRRV